MEALGLFHVSLEGGVPVPLAKCFHRVLYLKSVSEWKILEWKSLASRQNGKDRIS